MKQLVPFYSAFLWSLACLPVALGDYPVGEWDAWNESVSGRCPKQGWMQYSVPEEAGWSTGKLEQAHAYFESLDSAAAMVIYDGAVLASWGDVQTRYMCHSVRKSLLSALYGIHVAEGNIDLEKTLAELKIDDDPPLTAAEKQARVVDLLRSRSGIYHPAAYETAKMKAQRPARGSHPPGEIFWYNNWDFNVLGTIFERVTGKTIFEEFQNRFAIQDSKRFQLLDLILQARTARPKSDPVLIPWKNPAQATDFQQFDQDRLAQFTGNYQFENFRLEVQLIDGELAIRGPRMGLFRLLPRSPTEFIMEDIGAQVVFELDENGNPLQITIEIAPGVMSPGRAHRAN